MHTVCRAEVGAVELDMRGGGEGWRLVRGLDRTARLGSVLTQERWCWVMQHVVRALARCRLGSLQCVASTAVGSAQRGADMSVVQQIANLQGLTCKCKSQCSTLVTWPRTCVTQLESPERHGGYRSYIMTC